MKWYQEEPTYNGKGTILILGRFKKDSILFLTWKVLISVCAIDIKTGSKVTRWRRFHNGLAQKKRKTIKHDTE